MNKLFVKVAVFAALAVAASLWLADGISVAQLRSLPIPRGSGGSAGAGGAGTDMYGGIFQGMGNYFGYGGDPSGGHDGCR